MRHLLTALAALTGADYCAACGWWTRPNCGH